MTSLVRTSTVSVPDEQNWTNQLHSPQAEEEAEPQPQSSKEMCFSPGDDVGGDGVTSWRASLANC